MLDAAESGGYDLPITTDQNVRYQQNIANRSIAIMVLLSAAWPLIERKVEDIRVAVDDVRAGELMEIAI